MMRDAATLDLFGDPPTAPLYPQGFEQWADVIDPALKRELVARIDEVELSPFRFQGWTGKRLTQSFGWAYDFENGSFAEAPPMPDWLHDVRGRAAQVVGIAPAQLVQALVIRYDPGAGIGWHRDRPVFEHVVGLSLGSAATLRLRKRDAIGFTRRSAPLAPRSLYRLSGDVRDLWEHSIVPMQEVRWSITFRSLRHQP